ncbi:MAG TPA: TonB-dependent receptor [Candidatus Angelobacter sp.]|jgi:iron complex outermembrane receptor protein/vitamin B12 transporter|nr:TonB-dependent receptor [Candidatus Angelobacter sp.]
MRSLCYAGLALAFAFAALSAVAENNNIHGTVTDPLGAVVPGAQVQLFRESKLVGATTTDSEGKYRFSPLAPGRYRVKTQAPSFSQQQSDAIYVSSSSNAAVDITLKVGSVSQQIVVSATGTSLPETQTGASISVVTSDQFQYKPEVLEPLRQVPGAQVLENGQRGINESLFIRGGESKFNKVLLDGIPLNEIGGTVDFGGVFTTGIDQVEVLRGPNSVLYGADALAGVVNMTSLRGTTFTPQLSYAIDAGNFSSLHNDASLGGIFRQLDYFSEFGRYDGGNTSANPHFHNATYAGNFGWTPGASTSLRLTIRRVAAKVDVPNAIDFFGVPDDSFQTEDNTYIGATLQNQTTSHWHNSLRYGATRQSSEFVNPSPTGILDPVSGNFLGNVVTIRGANGFSTTGQAILDFAGDYPQQFFILNNSDLLTFQSDYSFGAHLNALFAFNYENERGPKPAERNNYSYTGELHGSLWSRLYATLGVGVEKNAVFGLAATPRASLAYYLVRPRSTGAFAGTKLKFNYGQGIQEPDIFSADNSLFALLLQQPDGQQLISQFHVGPIGAVRSRSLDAGVEQLSWSGRAKFGVTFFYNRFTNEIEFVSPDGLALLGVPEQVLAAAPFGASINSLATRSLGAETEVELSLGHGFMARAAYTYLDGLVQRSFSSDELFPSFNPQFPDIPIGAFSPLVGNRPFNRAPHTASFYLGYARRKLALTLSGNFIGRRDSSTFLLDSSFGASMLLPNHNLAAAYQKIDVSGSYRLNRYLQIYSAIENLASQHYDPAPGFPALPFNFRSGIKVTLGGEATK